MKMRAIPKILGVFALLGIFVIGVVFTIPTGFLSLVISVGVIAIVLVVLVKRMVF